VPSCRVYKQIKGFETWVKYNSPGSNIDVLRKVYEVAASCCHLAHAIVPPHVHLREAQYRVTLTGYGPQANPSTVQVLICYMLFQQSQLLQQTGTLLVPWQHALLHAQILTSTSTQPCIGFMRVCLQDARRFSQHCCEAAAVLHHNDFVMRDFRLSNVLTRAGQEGDYVVIDLEYAGPSGQPWSQDMGLAGWDDNTLTMVRRVCTVSFIDILYAHIRTACCWAEPAALLRYTLGLSAGRIRCNVRHASDWFDD